MTFRGRGSQGNRAVSRVGFPQRKEGEREREKVRCHEEGHYFSQTSLPHPSPLPPSFPKRRAPEEE